MMEKIVIIRKAMDGFNGGERVCANLCNSLSGGADIFFGPTPQCTESSYIVLDSYRQVKL